jgi:hypothetical protein
MIPWWGWHAVADPSLRRERAVHERQEKKEFAVASGEPDKQDSGQQAANSTINSTPLQEMSK